MEIPELVTQRLGEEQIESAVNLGDEDIVCFTPSRTLIYRGESLLSDDSLEVYDHDVVRLDVSEGRRKAKFSLEYVDRMESFSIASSRFEPVLERLLAGILGTADVLEDGEGVLGVYRFSELTLIISEARLVKHIGSYVWDGDYEEFPFSKVTGLEFEEGSVATQFVISVDGRPRRIKAPNSEAPVMRQKLTRALCAYHDVQSLEQLNSILTERAEAHDNGETGESSSKSDLVLDDSITPLVGGSDEESEEESAGSEPTNAQAGQDPLGDASTPEVRAQSAALDISEDESQRDSAVPAQSGPAAPTQPGDSTGVDAEEFEALTEQVDTLTAAVKRQNELLEKQHNTIRRLIQELQEQ